jgi:L-aspartate oxidase
MALRAGVAVADLEFVQFHPTALHHPEAPRPLLSEALRGHGAVLRDAAGERFVDELLPRDEVSRAITATLLDQGTDHVWLDVSPIENFDEHFPTIAATMRRLGFDPPGHWLPVAPAAHYFCGGIVTDLDGASALPGLWAAGETTCTGVHGANRLASNSLLDGMVFGFRVVEAVERGKEAAEPNGAMRSVLALSDGADGDATHDDIGGTRVEGWDPEIDVDVIPLAGVETPKLREELQRVMTTDAGVLRDASSLADARRITDAVGASVVQAQGADDARPVAELRNLVDVARGLLASASAREETRGAHTRRDFPARDDERFLRRLVLAGEPVDHQDQP